MTLLRKPSHDPHERFDALLERGGPCVVPGVHSPLVGLQAKRAGFQCVYLSGAAFSASMGLPDIGLFTLSELCEGVRQLRRICDLPVIVDADTGFGEAIQVARSLRELEAAGATAVQIEDQESPKRCGHLQGKRLIPPEAMAEKIAAAAAVRHRTRIVARTDARAVEGLDGAIARARAYREAGADIIFPEALESEAEFDAFAGAVAGYKLANMTEFGRSPNLSAARLSELGYHLVIFPVSALRVASFAVERFFDDLKREGRQHDWLERMMTRADLYRLLDYDDYEGFDQDVHRQIRGLPKGQG